MSYENISQYIPIDVPKRVNVNIRSGVSFNKAREKVKLMFASEVLESSYCRYSTVCSHERSYAHNLVSLYVCCWSYQSYELTQAGELLSTSQGCATVWSGSFIEACSLFFLVFFGIFPRSRSTNILPSVQVLLLKFLSQKREFLHIALYHATKNPYSPLI